MPALRDRILEALDDLALSDLSEAALVGVLAEQLKSVKATLFEAQSAVIKEGVRANDIQRNAAEEVRRLRTDPLAAVYGDFYFRDLAHDVLYIVSIDGRHVQLAKRAGRVDYVMQQLSAESFEVACK